jgi:hypothetical protein
MPASSSGAAPAGVAALGKPVHIRQIRKERLVVPVVTLGGMVETTFPTTEYFRAVRSRSDRAKIRELLPDQMTVHNAFFDRTFRP